MIDKLRRIWWAAVDCLESMTKKERIAAIVGNVVFLFLFFFWGIPSVGILTYFFGFVAVELFYLIVVYFIKTHLMG